MHDTQCTWLTITNGFYYKYAMQNMSLKFKPDRFLFQLPSHICRFHIYEINLNLLNPRYISKKLIT
jgi:hypothetical protein